MWRQNVVARQALGVLSKSQSIQDWLLQIREPNQHIDTCHDSRQYINGLVLLSLGELEESLDLFRAKRTSNREDLFSLLEGVALERLGQHPEALHVWRRGRLAPYFESRGRSEIGRKNYSEAAALFSLALEIEPNSLYAYRGLGTAFRLGQAWRESSVAYAKIVARKPDDLDANFNLGVVMLELRDFAGARKQAQRVLEIDHTYQWAYILMGNTYRLEGKYDESEFWYSQISRIAEWEGVAFKYLGINAIDQRNGDKAVQLLQKVKTDSSPDTQAEIQFWLGRAYALQGRYDLALQELESATRLKPEIGTYHLALAHLHKNNGRIDQARSSYLRVLQIEPDNAQAKSGLAELIGMK